MQLQWIAADHGWRSRTNEIKSSRPNQLLRLILPFWFFLLSTQYSTGRFPPSAQ
jgi:hypothetical protein